MKIRHKKTGNVLEVMAGTKFAQSAYELLDVDVEQKPAEVEHAREKATVRTKSKKKPAVEVEEKAKLDVDVEQKPAEVDTKAPSDK